MNPVKRFLITLSAAVLIAAAALAGARGILLAQRRLLFQTQGSLSDTALSLYPTHSDGNRMTRLQNTFASDSLLDFAVNYTTREPLSSEIDADAADERMKELTYLIHDQLLQYGLFADGVDKIDSTEDDALAQAGDSLVPSFRVSLQDPTLAVWYCQNEMGAAAFDSLTGLPVWFAPALPDILDIVALDSLVWSMIISSYSKLYDLPLPNEASSFSVLQDSSGVTWTLQVQTNSMPFRIAAKIPDSSDGFPQILSLVVLLG